MDTQPTTAKNLQPGDSILWEGALRRLDRVENMGSYNVLHFADGTAADGGKGTKWQKEIA